MITPYLVFIATLDLILVESLINVNKEYIKNETIHKKK